jgi:hypothetical protein
MPVYETRFDIETKQVTRHSEVTDYHDLEEVEMMKGQPFLTRGNYLIYYGGVLFSTFAWSLPSAALAVNADPFHGS